jgi:phosphatidylglycerophosphate synthase
MTTSSVKSGETPRRVLATRSARWAIALAHWLAQHRARPNAVSGAGVVIAAAASAAFAVSGSAGGGPRAILLVVAAAGIQLRLLCNLLDGMIAVEHGFKTKTGDIYNDLPDRLADVAILVGAGYSASSFAGGSTLGWAAAVMAVLTAYVRLLAGSLGVTQHFIGPMAKQHRMFTLTLATLVAVGETLLDAPPRAIHIGLAVIVAGSVVTVFRRTTRMAREVNAR